MKRVKTRCLTFFLIFIVVVVLSFPGIPLGYAGAEATNGSIAFVTGSCVSTSERGWIKFLEKQGRPVIVKECSKWSSSELANVSLIVFHAYAKMIGNAMNSGSPFREAHENGKPILEIFGTDGARALGYVRQEATRQIGASSLRVDFNAISFMSVSPPNGTKIGPASFKVVELLEGNLQWAVKKEQTNYFIMMYRESLGSEGRYLIITLRDCTNWAEAFVGVVRRAIDWAIDPPDSNPPTVTMQLSKHVAGYGDKVTLTVTAMDDTALQSVCFLMIPAEPDAFTNCDCELSILLDYLFWSSSQLERERYRNLYDLCDAILIDAEPAYGTFQQYTWTFTVNEQVWPIPSVIYFYADAIDISGNQASLPPTPPGYEYLLPKDVPLEDLIGFRFGKSFSSDAYVWHVNPQTLLQFPPMEKLLISVSSATLIVVGAWPQHKEDWLNAIEIRNLIRKTTGKPVVIASDNRVLGGLECEAWDPNIRLYDDFSSRGMLIYDLPPLVLSNYDIIFIGKPEDNRLINSIFSEAFSKNTGGTVIPFHEKAGFLDGFLIYGKNSPYNQQKKVFLISGTTNGATEAAEKLIMKAFLDAATKGITTAIDLSSLFKKAFQEMFVSGQLEACYAGAMRGLEAGLIGGTSVAIPVLAIGSGAIGWTGIGELGVIGVSGSIVLGGTLIGAGIGCLVGVVSQSLRTPMGIYTEGTWRTTSAEICPSGVCYPIINSLSDEFQRISPKDALKELDGTEGLNDEFKDKVLKGDRGATNTAKLAAALKRVGYRVVSLVKHISTNLGPTDVDILTEDIEGNTVIFESKGYIENEDILEWTKKDLGNKIARFREFFGNNVRIVVAFTGGRDELVKEFQQFIFEKGVSFIQLK